MSPHNKDHPSLVQEGDAKSSLSRRNFIGATAVAVGGLLTAAAALADERAAKEGSRQELFPMTRRLYQPKTANCCRINELI